MYNTTLGPIISLIPATNYSGAMVGAPFAAILADRFGRRVGMFCGAVALQRIWDRPPST